MTEITEDNLKKCPRCKNKKTKSKFGKNKTNKDGLSTYCKECTANYKKEKPKTHLLTMAKNRAKENNIEFDLKESDITIPRFCPILGIKLEFSEYEEGNYSNRTDNTPSLDRIDPNKGYVKNNVAVISWRANHLKGYGSLNDFSCIKNFLFNRELFFDLTGEDSEHLESLISHINNVKENCCKLSSRILKLKDFEKRDWVAISLLARGHRHDNSKFYGIEWIYLRDNVKLHHPELFNTALYQHVITNDHHPEFHIGGIESMPDDALAEMVCDWKARSDEMGTNLIEYIKENASKRFDFKINTKIYKKIVNFVDILLEKPFS